MKSRRRCGRHSINQVDPECPLDDRTHISACCRQQGADTDHSSQSVRCTEEIGSVQRRREKFLARYKQFEYDQLTVTALTSDLSALPCVSMLVKYILVKFCFILLSLYLFCSIILLYLPYLVNKDFQRQLLVGTGPDVVKLRDGIRVNKYNCCCRYIVNCEIISRNCPRLWP